MKDKLEIAAFVLFVLVVSAGAVIWDNWDSGGKSNVQNAEAPYMTPDATKLLPTVPVPAQSEHNVDLALASINSSVSDAGWPDIASLFGDIVNPVGPVQADSVPVVTLDEPDNLVRGYDRTDNGYFVNGQVVECSKLDALEGSALLAWNGLASTQQVDILTLCEAW